MAKKVFVDINAFRKLIGKNPPPMPALDLSTETLGVLGDYIEEGKVAVLLFWSMRCCGCPDTLDILEDIASRNENVQFISVNISVQKEDIKRTELLRWPHFKHLYVDEASKHAYAYDEFGVKFLPHCTIINQSNIIVRNGGNFSVDKASVQSEISKLFTSSSA